MQMRMCTNQIRETQVNNQFKHKNVFL